jgi:apolipoprotein N-acyltransferase
MKTLYKHILWWFAFPILGILNGTLREYTYKIFVGDLTAHQISTVTGIIFFGIVFYFIFKKWKIESVKYAILTGLIWLSLTILFEFGFGHYVMGNSWEKLFHDYNLSKGRVWGVLLIWITIAPYIFYKILNRKNE